MPPNARTPAVIDRRRELPDVPDAPDSPSEGPLACVGSDIPDKPSLRRARRETMLAALSEGATWAEVAKRAGVNERTLRHWCAADPALAAAALEARDQADDLVECVTFQNCLNADPSHNALRIFWLRTRRREVYSDVSKLEHAGPTEIVVRYENDWRGAGPKTNLAMIRDEPEGGM